MADRYHRRTAADYAEALAALLPTGPAWRREADAPLMQLVDGLAQIWGDVAGRADDLLVRETDPRRTIEMIGDWERAFGLPDACMAPAVTLEQRRARLLYRMTLLGGQSRAFFIGVAAYLGYVITIDELSPFMCGISRCGEDFWQVGAPEIRFTWIVNVSGVPIWWFRAGVGESGKDHLAEWQSVLDLECLINRYKPAHTAVVFSYLS